MPESVICRKEVESLQVSIGSLLLDLVSRSEVSDGDFHSVESAIGDFIQNVRSLVVESGLRLSMECSSRGYCCPQCERYLTAWGKCNRHFVTSQGEADVAVVRYRCVECKCDYYPIIEANGLTGTRFTLGARERIVSQAAEDPYAEVSQNLPELGITVSAKEVDRQVRQAYDFYKEPVRQEMEWYRKQQEVKTAATFLSEEEYADVEGIGKPRCLFSWKGWHNLRWAQVSSDGAFWRSTERDELGKLRWFGQNSGLIRAFEPTREGEKQYRLDAQTFHAAGVVTLDDTFDRLFAVLEQCPSSVENVVYISDDGQGLLSRAREYLNRAERRRFKKVILMLDSYHASQHVGSGADAIWGAGSKQAKWLKDNALNLLKEPEGVQRIIRFFFNAIRDGRPECISRLWVQPSPECISRLWVQPSPECILQIGSSTSVETDKDTEKLADKEELIRSFRYLWRNRHYMKYALWRKMGLPIGSGAMESGVKQVCVKRLRQPGMMWTTEGANAMLHIRAAHLSGILTTSFELERAEHRKKLEKFLAPVGTRKNYKAAV